MSDSSQFDAPGDAPDVLPCASSQPEIDSSQATRVPHAPAAAERIHDRTRRRGIVSGLLWMALFASLAIGLRYGLGGIVEEVRYAWTRGQQRAEVDTAREQLGATPISASPFRLVAQSVGPSVVHIDTLRPRGTRETPFAGHPSLERRMETTGQGSGVIIDAEGYILTNYHVIEGATAVRVRLSDGRNISEAEVVGVDPPTDLAVVKVDAEGLIPAPWGDSDKLEVGDWVLAVGNPFGLDRSVTAGIVSAKRRRNVVHNMPYQDFLQTDAAVNPGNSGGPLVNLKGEVVGVTTAIVGESYQGVGFAIPSSLARDVYNRLRTAGRVDRGWLGVEMQEITPEIAQRLSVPQQGVLVASVVGVPAREAGMAVGDVIVAWNGQKVADPEELKLKVAQTTADSEAKIDILREGKPQTLTVLVGQRRQ
ncbi:MAG: trypsin-like peptidase domain-containing protein [Planctomycetia bacterium]|nr:trypsin-like peptidase domain-containing protein [Planctomycetia bacterium]